MSSVFFHLQTGNHFPKPQCLSLNAPFRKLHIFSVSCQVSHLIWEENHFTNSHLLWLNLRDIILSMMPVHQAPQGQPYFDVSLVSNCFSCQRGQCCTSGSYLCCSWYMQGRVMLTDALPGLSISHAALNGYEWMEIIGPHLSCQGDFSLKRGWTESCVLRPAVGRVCGNATDLPVSCIPQLLSFPLLPSVHVKFSVS